MLTSRTVLDARFKKLMAQQLIGGDGGAINPLSRMAFIDAGNLGSQNGSIAEPFKTIGAWAASIPSTTAADNAIAKEGLVTPQAYVENVNLPAYRSVTLSGATVQPVTGNLVLANTVAAGGKNPAASQLVSVHNMAFSGSCTVTDDATAPTTLLFLSNDETVIANVQGNFDSSGCTHLAAVEMLNSEITGDFISTATATGAELFMVDSVLGGNVTARLVDAANSTFLGGIITLATGDSFFVGCSFGGMAVNGVAGTRLRMDGPSMASFAENNGVAGPDVKILVVGGYAGFAYEGPNLTNADVSVSLDGTGATAGFTAGGNHYTLPAATLNAPHDVKLLTGGGEQVGDVIRITRQDATANAYTIHNQAGALIGTLVASVEGFFEAVFKGGDWQMSAIGTA